MERHITATLYLPVIAVIQSKSVQPQRRAASYLPMTVIDIGSGKPPMAVSDQFTLLIQDTIGL